MTLSEILDKIKERWAKANNFESIIGLQKAPEGAGTGTEGLLLLCNYIRYIKRTDEAAFQEIKDLAEELFAYENQTLKRS